jgi:hypothetical protein
VKLTDATLHGQERAGGSVGGARSDAHDDCPFPCRLSHKSRRLGTRCPGLGGGLAEGFDPPPGWAGTLACALNPRDLPLLSSPAHPGVFMRQPRLDGTADPGSRCRIPCDASAPARGQCGSGARGRRAACGRQVPLAGREPHPRQPHQRRCRARPRVRRPPPAQRQQPVSPELNAALPRPLSDGVRSAMWASRSSRAPRRLLCGAASFGDFAEWVCRERGRVRPGPPGLL